MKQWHETRTRYANPHEQAQEYVWYNSIVWNALGKGLEGTWTVARNKEW